MTGKTPAGNESAKRARAAKPTASESDRKATKPKTVPTSKTAPTSKAATTSRAVAAPKMDGAKRAKKAARDAPTAHDRDHRRREAERAAREAAAKQRQKLAKRQLTIAVAFVAVSFLVAYSFSASRSQARAGGLASANGAPASTSATLEGGIQKISIDASTGSFNPGVVNAKAGVPIEMTFSQAPGGCLAGVYFPQFNINEDLTAGPKTVKIPAQQKGEYQFFCQMQMVSGTLVIQ